MCITNNAMVLRRNASKLIAFFCTITVIIIININRNIIIDDLIRDDHSLQHTRYTEQGVRKRGESEYIPKTVNAQAQVHTQASPNVHTYATATQSVHSATANAAPSPMLPQRWSKCANEGETCNVGMFSHTMIRVKYGIGMNATEKDVSSTDANNVQCTNLYFSQDPYPMHDKECWFKPYLTSKETIIKWNECRDQCVCNVNNPVQIENVFYINLDKRKDRKKQIEVELSTAGFKFQRFSAWDGKAPVNSKVLAGCWGESPFTGCAGQIGCQMSHVQILKNSIKNHHSNVLIFEDDFAFNTQWKSTGNVHTMLEDIVSRLGDWDVVALGLYLQKWAKVCKMHQHPRFEIIRIYEAQTTSAYLVNNRYMRTLMDAISPEKCDVKKDYHTAIDQCWKPLMRKALWFGVIPQAGSQAASFSDIEDRKVDYTTLFK